MGAFLSYSIISGLAMLAMYLGYKIFLARDNQHSFNRGVLLLIYAVSWVCPLAASWVEYHRYDTRPDIVQLPVGHSEVVVDMVVRQNTLAHQLWSSVLVWIFIAGMAVVAVRTAITWFRLLAVIRQGEKIRRDGYTLVVTSDERLAPFSWMHYVVVGRGDYADNCAAIATHELKHVKSMHWIDLLVAQAVCIVNWFNPAAWLMRDELMLVHEYQADMAVVDSGADAQEYQLLLIKKAAGSRFPSLANSLNHSKLKKRITMMYKEKSGAGRRMKVLALVPVLMLVLGVAVMPPVRAAVSTISSTGLSLRKGSEKTEESKNDVPEFRVTDINNYDNKTTVRIEVKGLGNYIKTSGGTLTTCGRTYQAINQSCVKTGSEAVIEIVFPFLSEFEATSMTVNVNDEAIPFNLEELFARATFDPSELKPAVNVDEGALRKQAPSTLDDAINSALVDNPLEVAALVLNKNVTPGDIYVNGVKIGEADMHKLNAEDIALVVINKQNKTTNITTKSASASSGMRILLDGREIDQAEMNAYPADKIASVSVDKQTNTISITSK
ncbi:MAG: M56 family metallopeptidase [Muribaculaceae bacterium]|nr:M56 family metallopeptidase [Muribaculaceae bacterium]